MDTTAADLPDASGEPQWLNGEERSAWMSLMTLLIKLPMEMDTQLRRDAGMNAFDYHLMAGLSEAPDRTLRMSVLAALTDGSLQRLSQVVSRLEKSGWVKRSPDPNDGRSTLATLTEGGWDKMVLTAPGHVRTVRSLVFDPLTKAQVRQLTTISQRITAAIDPDSQCQGNRSG